jgi:hypothetical protein
VALRKRSGKLVDAREPGRTLGQIEPAPGSYVKVRFDGSAPAAWAGASADQLFRCPPRMYFRVFSPEMLRPAASSVSDPLRPQAEHMRPG